MGIVDVGASFVGEPPLYQPLLQSGDARLVGFEPDAAACAKLGEMFGAPHRFFPYFIGDGRPGVFRETNWVATGSLFAPNPAVMEKFHNLHEVATLVAEHPVQTRRLDDIPGIGDVDFLKLDVQGAELMVLQGAERTLRDVVMVQVEVEFLELYAGQPLFADVDRYLRSQGFMFHTFCSTGSRCFKPLLRDGNPNIGLNQVLWSDAVYVRSWLDPERISPAKLANLAILLNDLSGSVDLCHLVLGFLDDATGSAHASTYLSRLTGG
ncbi:MAG: FkbM family methyltransferase [Burkholderiales bacterium]